MVADWRKKEVGVDNSSIKGSIQFKNEIAVVRALSCKEQKPTLVDLNIRGKRSKAIGWHIKSPGRPRGYAVRITSTNHTTELAG